MNILFNCSEYPPMPSGGIGSVVKIVAEGLAKRGHNVFVAGYYFMEASCDTHVVRNGVHIYCFSLGHRASTFGRYSYAIRNMLHLAGRRIQKELDYYEDRLAELIRQHDIDILELTDFYDFNDCRSKLHYRSFDIPVVMRFHGCQYYISANCGKNVPWIKTNDLAHFARADRYSYVSSYIRDYVHGMGGEYSSDSETIIHNMVEDEFLSGTDFPSGSRTILFFGKLTETKGAYATIQAFCRFHRTHPEWKLVMAGAGNIDALLLRVPASVRPNIVCTGFCDRQAIMKHIDDCSFVCLPSFFETFGMTTLEAMARSRAVIGTSRTSGPEIIDDGVNGLLVEPSDIDMICEKMTQLADDPEYCSSLGAAAYEKIESRLCTGRILDEMERYYNTLI